MNLSLKPNALVVPGGKLICTSYCSTALPPRVSDEISSFVSPGLISGGALLSVSHTLAGFAADPPTLPRSFFRAAFGSRRSTRSTPNPPARISSSTDSRHVPIASVPASSPRPSSRPEKRPPSKTVSVLLPTPGM